MQSKPDKSANTGVSPPQPDVPELDAKIQGLLGDALRLHYDDLVNAPIPDRFLALLAELEAKEQRDE